jgi:DNA mismatch repair protein MutH
MDGWMGVWVDGWIGGEAGRQAVQKFYSLDTNGIAK